MFSKKAKKDLFDALPPSSATQAKGEPAAKPERVRVEKTQEYKKVDAAEPVSQPRAQVEDEPKVEKPRATAQSAAPVQRPRQVHTEPEPIMPSSNINFYLVVSVCICFSVATGLFSYKLGKDNGYEKGAEYGANLRAKKQTKIYSRKYADKKSTKNAKIQSVSMAGTSISKLPVSVDKLSAEQKKVVKPAAPLKRYTIQVITFGRNQKKRTDSLVGYLKESGVEAFGDHRNGVVYAGRFSKRNSISDALQKRIARFNWRGTTFKDAFLNRIPTSLLEDKN
jgi:hypothetical protein